jgi:putative SOS response-associated peptidase YedK
MTAPPEQLLLRFAIEQLAFDYQPRYNIAPGQLIPTVISHEGSNRLGLLKWGFVPSWAKDTSFANKIINAKSESVHDKPAFKNSLLRKRCLIPADGFYEWMPTAGGKQPMRIVLKSREIFALAGLYDTWTSPDGSKLHTVTILTTAPNKLMEPIHNRMPVIIKSKYESIWLNREQQDIELLQSIMVPYPSEELEAYPVSAAVGNVKNEIADCIEPL